MEMQVINALASIGTDIGDQSPASGKFGGDFVDERKQSLQYWPISGSQLGCRSLMGPRHYQYVDWSLGVEITEGETMVVLGHHVRRNVAGGDRAKDAVGHSAGGYPKLRQPFGELVFRLMQEQ